MKTQLVEYVKHVVTKDISNADTKKQFIAIAEFLEKLSPDEYLFSSDDVLYEKYKEQFNKLGVVEDRFIDFFSNDKVDAWFTNRVNEKAGYFYRKKFREVNSTQKPTPADLNQLSMLEKLVNKKNTNDGVEYVIIQAPTDFLSSDNQKQDYKEQAGAVNYHEWKQQVEKTKLDALVQKAVAVDMNTNKVIEQKQVEQQEVSVKPKKIQNFFVEPMAKMFDKTKADFSTVNQPEKRYSFNVKDLHKYIKNDDEFSNN